MKLSFHRLVQAEANDAVRWYEVNSGYAQFLCVLYRPYRAQSVGWQ